MNLNCWWAFDRVGTLLALATIVISLLVLRYAARQFAGESRSRKFQMLAIGIVASIVSFDLAHSPRVLLASWVATSILTVWLLRSFDSTRSGRRAWREEALAFASVDLLLVVGFVVTFWLNPNLHWPAVATASLAAVGRAGLSIGRSWVVSTVNTPTPVSALLHAGVVNAGALLLFRLNSSLGDIPQLRWFLAAICLSTLLALGSKINTRVDLKGQLAVSTVAQMAFMLLTIALGWPLLAFTHLIGHGYYKAVRFMGSGGATQQRAARRRRAREGRHPSAVERAIGSLAIVLVALSLGHFYNKEAQTILALLCVAAISLWWNVSSLSLRSALLVWVLITSAMATYSMIVRALDSIVGHSTTWHGWSAPWWSLGLAVVLLSLSAIRPDHAHSKVAVKV